MEKKFRVLRVIGTVWKIVAWIVLILGILGAFGMLLTSILGGGFMSQMMRQYGQQGGIWTTAGGIVGGIVGFVIMLIVAVLYFLMLYAIGDLIYLFLDVEENTRLTSQWVSRLAPQAYTPAPPVYSPPPPAYPTPPPPVYPAPTPGQ
jgi:hypothetical protein